MKSSLALSLCFLAGGAHAFVGHVPVSQPRSVWGTSSGVATSAAAVAAPRAERRNAGRVVVTKMGWGDDVVFSKVCTQSPERRDGTEFKSAVSCVVFGGIVVLVIRKGRFEVERTDRWVPQGGGS